MTADGSRPPGASGPDADATASDGVAGGELLEGAITVVSVLLLVAILGYLVSQAIVAPAAPDPTATVESVEPVSPGEQGRDGVRVTVSLVNRGETGLDSIQVLVQCGGTERSLEFTHVPARGHRTGTAICPSGTTPTANVATWIGA